MKNYDKLTPTQLQIIESHKKTFKNVSYSMNNGGDLLLSFSFNGRYNTVRYGRKGHSFGIVDSCSEEAAINSGIIDN